MYVDIVISNVFNLNKQIHIHFVFSFSCQTRHAVYGEYTHGLLLTKAYSLRRSIRMVCCQMRIQSTASNGMVCCHTRHTVYGEYILMWSVVKEGIQSTASIRMVCCQTRRTVYGE